MARIGHKDFTTRPATREDLIAFYGKAPGETVRALVAEHEGQVVAVGGVMIERGWACAFSDHKDVGYSPRAALRFAREVVGQTIKRQHVHALSHTENERLLAALGFSRVGESEYGKVYHWMGENT